MHWRTGQRVIGPPPAPRSQGISSDAPLTRPHGAHMASPPTFSLTRPLYEPGAHRSVAQSTEAASDHPASHRLRGAERSAFGRDDALEFREDDEAERLSRRGRRGVGERLLGLCCGGHAVWVAVVVLLSGL